MVRLLRENTTRRKILNETSPFSFYFSKTWGLSSVSTQTSCGCSAQVLTKLRVLFLLFQLVLFILSCWGCVFKAGSMYAASGEPAPPKERPCTFKGRLKPVFKVHVFSA